VLRGEVVVSSGFDERDPELPGDELELEPGYELLELLSFVDEEFELLLGWELELELPLLELLVGYELELLPGDAEELELELPGYEEELEAPVLLRPLVSSSRPVGISDCRRPRAVCRCSRRWVTVFAANERTS
jgi:hypothetical protein